MYETARDRIPRDRVVRHPRHLLSGTYQDNGNDQARYGRRVLIAGERISNAKLTRREVGRIKRLRQPAEPSTAWPTNSAST